MSDQPVLYGFDGSTYVRTVRMLMADKSVAYDQVPVNVLAGEPRQTAHLARHPFGKVPVLDIDGMRLRETEAICRYVDEARPGVSRVPGTPKDRARMSEVIGLIDSYGYDALVGAAGYHLFPEFIGGKNDEMHAKCIADAKTLLNLLASIKDADPWLSGKDLSLADYFLAPILFYTSLTPDAEELIANGPLTGWWTAMQDVEAFKATEPDLG